MVLLVPYDRVSRGGSEELPSHLALRDLVASLAQSFMQAPDGLTLGADFQAGIVHAAAPGFAGCCRLAATPRCRAASLFFLIVPGVR